jgi:hypothetical protein
MCPTPPSFPKLVVMYLYFVFSRIFKSRDKK